MNNTQRHSSYLLRLFSLVKLLSEQQLAGPAIVQQLADYYASGASGRRMLRKDLDDLRKIGFEIEALMAPQRYVLKYNPFKTLFEDESLVALAFMQQLLAGQFPIRQLQEVFNVLMSHVDDDQRTQLADVSALRAFVHPVADYSAATPLFLPLNHAIQHQQQVRFWYQAPGKFNASAQHTVDPHAIEYREQHFYLVGYNQGEEKLIDFRFDRIDHTTLEALDTPVSDPQRDLHPYCFRYYVAQSLVERGLSKRFPRQRIVQEYADGSVEVEAFTRNSFYAIQGLLRYKAAVRVTWPPELVAEMKREIEQICALYAD